MEAPAKSTKCVTILVFFFAITSYESPSLAIRRLSDETSLEFIKTSCNKTLYPQLCFRTLSSHTRTIQTSPRILAIQALDVTLEHACPTSSFMVKMSKSHGLQPREVGAMQDCVDELSATVDELKKSIAEMNEITGSNFYTIMSDVQTWVSAALTDENTCSNGFAGKTMDGKVKTAVRAQIVGLAHLTSNALALVNVYALSLFMD